METAVMKEVSFPTSVPDDPRDRLSQLRRDYRDRKIGPDEFENDAHRLNEEIQQREMTLGQHRERKRKEMRKFLADSKDD